jgi:spermidine synthase
MAIEKRGGELWFREELYPDVEQGFLVSEILHEAQTNFQKMMILKTPRFGKVLVLDGVVQLTEEDEHFYHEAMSHCPLFLCDDPRKVLIIGGGDGGILREVLKHKSIQLVDMVEIDGDVVEASKIYLPEISEGAFTDPRAKLVIDDGAEFIKDKKNVYDVIIIDSTDPIGPAEVLFRTDFYEKVYGALKNGGIVIRQTGSSTLQPSECPANCRQMKEVFDDVKVVQVPVATYIGGNFTLVMGLKSISPFHVFESGIEERFQKASIKTKWYTPDIFWGATMLSPEFRERLEKERYGEELILDLYGCDYSILASTAKVAEWAKKTCGVIQMKPFGEPIAPDFGHGKNKTAGPSVVQLIETSAISAHYSPHWLGAYANIFTCTELPLKEAIKFTMDFFKAKKVRGTFIPRGSFANIEEYKEQVRIFEVGSLEDLENLEI